MESESEALIAKLVNSKEPFDNVSVPNFLKKTYEILQVHFPQPRPTKRV